jgi:hypothetical protein
VILRLALSASRTYCKGRKRDEVTAMREAAYCRGDGVAAVPRLTDVKLLSRWRLSVADAAVEHAKCHGEFGAFPLGTMCMLRPQIRPQASFFLQRCELRADVSQ